MGLSEIEQLSISSLKANEIKDTKYNSVLHVRFKDYYCRPLVFCADILDMSNVASSKFKALNICTAKQNMRKRPGV